MTLPYQRIHVVVNPASGHDEPIINVLNRVFHQHSVDWSISITRQFGDATEQAKAAIADGADLVAGYGGDGSQHEVANAVLGTDAAMGILPGGTGNGFAKEMAIPDKLEPAVALLCTSHNTKTIDVARVGDEFFIQRLYVGIEPEEQTSREMKDKYGVFAYAVSIFERSKNVKEIDYHVEVDGETADFKAFKAYLVNSGMMGTGLAITDNYSVEDGLLDGFFMDSKNIETLRGATDRFLQLNTAAARKYYRQGKKFSISTTPDQPVWADGEYICRTPITVEVMPAALRIAVA